jgi:hypothetical protein
MLILYFYDNVEAWEGDHPVDLAIPGLREAPGIVHIPLRGDIRISIDGPEKVMHLRFILKAPPLCPFGVVASWNEGESRRRNGPDVTDILGYGKPFRWSLSKRMNRAVHGDAPFFARG